MKLGWFEYKNTSIFPSPKGVAFSKGAEALGWEVVLEIIEDWLEKPQVREYDLIAFESFKRTKRRIAQLYTTVGVRAAIVDLGYLKRKDGYFQVSLDNLGWITPRDCPTDRFNRLDIKLDSGGKGQYILVCGQKLGDAQHQMGQNEMFDWAEETTRILKSVTDLPIYFRPHPGSFFKIPSADKIQDARQFPIDFAVKCSKGIVTYNSASGVQAIIQGVPLHCSPCANYAELSCPLKEVPTAESPNLTRRLHYLSRLAYSQWTLEEISQGLALDFILKQGVGNGISS